MGINYWPYILEQLCCCLILLPIFVFIMHCIFKRKKPKINIENVAEALNENDIWFLGIETTMDSLTYIFRCDSYMVKFICYPDLPVKYVKITSFATQGEILLKYLDDSIIEHNYISVSKISKSYLNLQVYYQIYILLSKMVVKK